jgi:hypothetical protein
MNPDDSIPVPKLDLVPKLKRSLSLWNPLDYLRLLYWLFFFPQALRWYEEKFGDGTNLIGESTWKKRWQWLQKNPIQQRLIWQSLILLAIITFEVLIVAVKLGININWFGVLIGVSAGLGMGFGSIGSSVTTGVAVGVASTVASVLASIVASVIVDRAYTVTYAVNLGIDLDEALRTAFSLGSGLTFEAGRGFGAGANIGISAMGASLVVAVGMANSISSGVAIRLAGSLAICLIFGLGLFVFSIADIVIAIRMDLGMVAIDRASSMNICLAFGVISCITFCVLNSVAILRPESWLLETINYFLNKQYQRKYYTSVTSIPIPLLSRQLSRWLEKDWQIGLYNANQLLAYTMQFIPVTRSINYVLSRTPSEQLLLRVSQLATNPFDWDLLKFASVSLNDNLQYSVIDGLFLFPSFIKRKLTKKLSIEPRLDTPARAVAAGFWYLYGQLPRKAEEAFDLVRDLPYGEEMWSLAETLSWCGYSGFSLPQIANLSLPPIPSPPHLRPASWSAIASFHRIIADVQVVQVSHSRSARSFALNRALGELDRILKHPEYLDGSEKSSILMIAKSWEKILLTATSEIGEIVILQPLKNPYIIGDPVQGSAFVGREDIMNQLAELWLLGQSVQSVVLYGHRRMGKTSILRNVHSHIGSTVYLAYVNLLLLSNPQGEADVLIFICDEIQRVTGMEPPSNRDFADFPENTCRRYIQQVCDRLENQKLIIALDEFEQIENFIRAGKIGPDFLQFLRGLIQLSPKIAFAFAGLHTLEEMTADYFHPFFASVIPICVGFLSLGSTRQLLANPDPDFLLDYQPETLDAIYDLTAGQPYLTQLIGFQLVRHYNNQVFECSRPRDPVLTTSDIQTIIEDPEFFDRGRYYFTGIWQQAAQDTPHQQAILKAIAPDGLTLSEISTHTNLAPADLQLALTVLDRHDVTYYKNDRYYIAVELFRRWILDRSPSI